MPQWSSIKDTQEGGGVGRYAAGGSIEATLEGGGSWELCRSGVASGTSRRGAAGSYATVV